MMYVKAWASSPTRSLIPRTGWKAGISFVLLNKLNGAIILLNSR
jgi:hypothetical protein